MSIELKVPQVGESITEVEIGQWLKSEGERVEKDDNVAVIETEKVTFELPAPVSGTLAKILKRSGESATVGEVIGYMEPGDVVEKKPQQPAAKTDGQAKPAESETKRTK